MFHAHPWPWHLLFISLHAANGALLYVITNKLFKHAGLRNGSYVALGGVLLFTVCPHISEVIVWKASFHYLQGFLLTLGIIYWVQQYQYKQRTRYVWYAVIAFICSAFSLEFFYLTPWFAASLVFFYYKVFGGDRGIFIKSIKFFILPMAIIFIGHLALLHFITGFYTSHLGDDMKQPLLQYMRKPPIHVFHNLFLGRFFAEDTKQHIHDFFATRKGLALFYLPSLIVIGVIIYRVKKWGMDSKAALLLLLWFVWCVVLVCPVWIPDIQYVIYDRYSYFMLPFLYILLCYGLVKWLPFKAAIGVFMIYAGINIYFTVKVNKYWRDSAHIVYNLSHNIPYADNKIILLLNVPTNMNGVQMIGSLPASAVKQIYNVNNEQKLNNRMYDVLAYNMISDTDGAHVAIYNDTLMHVTLNQWGTWWWYGRLGASSYENDAYRVNLMDPGHWYELILKHPASDYLLLYQVGDKWKTVDVNKKDVEQY